MTTPLTVSEARRQLRLSESEPVSPSDVKRAFRAAAKLHHPDVGEQPDADAFRLAVAAAAVLADGDDGRTSLDELLDRLERASAVGRPANTADVADAMRQSLDEIVRQFAERHRPTQLEDVPIPTTVIRSRRHNEVRVTNVPDGAVIVVEDRDAVVRVELHGRQLGTLEYEL